ncbi:MAG: hypothetical protein HN742_28225 [Lentisphaerae bacterium]|jgi:hypothetical protein|nr:hypothetical protein [Lentisphaerota bacterium]MBT5612617.1 hypothetical protein [Lentisphaerota bacterium]MBT7059276.1 hypothetical protein [Lentisphaerota bacterium]MBT7845793.1 hypothetical protein [Lentisphaerota bacterium]
MFGRRLKRELHETRAQLLVTRYTLNALIADLRKSGTLTEDTCGQLPIRARELLERDVKDVDRRRREGRPNRFAPVDAEALKLAYGELINQGD